MATATATAACPAGERAQLGGITGTLVAPVYASGSAIFPQAMYLDSTQTKVKTRCGVNGGSADGVLTSYAYCSAHPLRTVVSKTVSVATNTFKAATATCPAGTVVLNAGFKIPVGSLGGPPNAAIQKLLATAHTVTVRVVAFNATSFTAIAYCGPGAALTATSAQVFMASPTTHLTTVTAVCTSGKHLMFGGFDAQFPSLLASGTVLPFAMWAPSVSEWSVAGYNPGATSASLKAIAYCG